MRKLMQIIVVLTLIAHPHSVYAQENLKAMFEEAVGHMQAQEYDEAIEDFQRIIDIKPDLMIAYNLMGQAYLGKEGFLNSAIATFREAIRVNPQDPEAYFHLGTLHASTLRETDIAVDYFNKAIEVDPNFARAHFALAWIVMIDQKKPHEAAKLFEKTVEAIPQLAEAYYGLGLAYLQSNRRELALQPISQLRFMDREDLAVKLEQLMHTGDLAALERQRAAQQGGQPGVPPPPPQGEGPAPIPVSEAAAEPVPEEDSLPVE